MAFLKAKARTKMILWKKAGAKSAFLVKEFAQLKAEMKAKQKALWKAEAKT